MRNLPRLIALPILQAPEEALMGGQAVIEGVMMRSPHSYAVAVRQPGGTIAVAKEYLDKPSEKHPWLKYPLLRGLGTLGQAMVLGIRALRYSAEQAMDEPGKPAQADKKAELSNWLLAANLALSLGFFVFFYKYVPLSLATLISRRYPVAGNLLIFNFLDGIIRIVLFLGFLFFISQWKEIRRIFEYHGAEHKVVWAFEKRGAIDVRDGARLHTLPPPLWNQLSAGGDGHRHGVLYVPALPLLWYAVRGPPGAAAGNCGRLLRIHPLCGKITREAVALGGAAGTLAATGDYTRAGR